MGPCPRDAQHPPHAHWELGSGVRAQGTSKVPPPPCIPSHPAFAPKLESRCKSQRV